MQPHILEKALHAWQQWGGLIRDARFSTNFEPALLENKNEYKRWEQEVGWEKVIRLSFEALEQIDLPWYFGLYWLACFCADYKQKDPVDFSRITLPPQDACEVWTNLVSKELVKDRGVVMLYHQGSSGKKIYPPYPFILEAGYPFGIKRGEKPSDSGVNLRPTKQE